MQLIDVDEDGCLSIGEVFKMIYFIEKNFVLEMNHFTIMNLKSFKETALRNSFEKFKLVMCYRKVPLEQIDNRSLNQNLKTFSELQEVFEKDPRFLKSFLPKNIQIESFIVILCNLVDEIRKSGVQS
jgi:hypothetical protein